MQRLFLIHHLICQWVACCITTRTIKKAQQLITGVSLPHQLVGLHRIMDWFVPSSLAVRHYNPLHGLNARLWSLSMPWLGFTNTRLHERILKIVQQQQHLIKQTSPICTPLCCMYSSIATLVMLVYMKTQSEQNNNGNTAFINPVIKYQSQKRYPKQ